MANMENGSEGALVTQRSDNNNVQQPEQIQRHHRPRHQGENDDSGTSPSINFNDTNNNTSSIEATSSSSSSENYQHHHHDQPNHHQHQQQTQHEAGRPIPPTTLLPRRRISEKTLVRGDPSSPEANENNDDGEIAGAAAVTPAPRVLRRPRLASTRTAAAAAAAAVATDADGLVDDDDDQAAGRGHKRSKRETLPDIAKRIPIEALRPYLRMPLVSAAKEMNISATTLKRLCRHYGVKRWPFRQISGIDRTVCRLEGELKSSFHRSAFSASVSPADAAELREPITDHIRELKNHREHIIKSTLDGGSEPFRGKLSPTVGVFAALQQQQRRQWQNHREQQYQEHQQHHQQHHQQQLRPAYIDPKEDTSGVLQVAPPASGCGGAPMATAWGNTGCGASGENGMSGGRSMSQGGAGGGGGGGEHYGYYQDTTTNNMGENGGGGGGYYGSAAFSSPPSSSLLSSHPRNPTSHHNHSHNHTHHYNNGNSFSPASNPVAVVTPGTTVEDVGSGGGGHPGSMAPSAQAVAAAAATVAVEAEAAVAMATEDDSSSNTSHNTSASRFSRDLTCGGVGGGNNGGGSHHEMPRMASATGMYGSDGSSFSLSCPPSSSSASPLHSDSSCPSVAVPLLRSGCAKVSGLGYGCGTGNGNGQALQQQQHQQQQQQRDVASYRSPVGRGAMAPEGGVTPTSSAQRDDWYVVPMTPTPSQGGARTRDTAQSHHPAYELDLRQQQGKYHHHHQPHDLPQRQQQQQQQQSPPSPPQEQSGGQVHSYDNNNNNNGYQMTTPLPRQQQQQQEWSPKENNRLHTNGGGSVGTSSSSCSTSDEFLIAAAESAAANAASAAAAAAVTAAAVPARGGTAAAGGSRHAREASIDFALDEVSNLGGEMVFDNRDLYALTTTSSRANDHIIGGIGGVGYRNGDTSGGTKKNAHDTSSLNNQTTAGGARLGADAACGFTAEADPHSGLASRSLLRSGGGGGLEDSNSNSSSSGGGGISYPPPSSATAGVMQNPASPWNISNVHAPMFLAARCT